MEIVILLVPLAAILLGVAVAIFFWALRNNQFDDLDSPSWRIIYDDRDRNKEDHD